jgi:hypothetical protein
MSQSSKGGFWPIADVNAWPRMENHPRWIAVDRDDKRFIAVMRSSKSVAGISNLIFFKIPALSAAR